MALRNIVKIDEDKCNGCGDCVTACAEGAIEIIDGKAKLVSEVYCDGLGACLGHCPQDAITIEQREAEEFDEKATEEHLAQKKQPDIAESFSGCPGMQAARLSPPPSGKQTGPVASQLGQWPVQLKLVSPSAPYLAGSDLLVTADCVPFAMGDYHSRFLKDHTVVVGCPKLDDVDYYVEKLAAILKANDLASLTVLHMEVPCCSGLTYIAREAIKAGGKKMSFQDVTVSLGGEVRASETVEVN